MTGKKYSNKNVFVLPSYVGLPYILRNFNLKDSENIFLTNNPALYQWLASLKLEVIQTPALTSDLSRKAIGKLKRANKVLSEHFRACNIYHFFYLSNIPMLHLLQLLSRENKLHYLEQDPTLPKINLLKIRPFKELKKMGTAYLAFGLILNLWPEIYIIDKKFMCGKRIESATLGDDTADKPILKENQIFIQKSITPYPIDILYVDNISVHFPEAARYIASLLSKITDIGRKVHIKPHPTFKPIEEFKKFPLVEAEVPSEICMQTANLILGISSTSLNEPIHSKVISLFNLVQKDYEISERYREIIKSDQVIFVTSEEELFREIMTL